MIEKEDDDDGEDFDESLAQGMESLLLQLAGSNPPGPMPDKATKTGPIETPSPPPRPWEGGMSPEEEEKAWQKAIEMMLSGEGLEALGLDKNQNAEAGPSQPPTPASASAPAPAPARPPNPSFDDTIRQTMEQLKSAGSNTKTSDDATLAALLAQLGSDPSALDGLGDGDDELGGLLDGMMAQLMTREVLEDPMVELASKYPGYLASPPAGVTPSELEKYRKQSALVDTIVKTFKKPDFNDDKDGREIARLVGEMQDLGGPPKEIMGDLPEGFDLGALGGDEACTIM
ncbi:Pex19 protein [Kockovaella imperatae]|uniref:Pex19 protein n=1 Tax=Kockovaella imperatae TaxID=4999 RepID=A0A1Y1UPX7_9TREE|nr:Pex19 protein [Kockovaella imperatae]ORX40022.1 Pex19 protein [Kockovaella imperatae]